jgi:beta-galactosidase
MIETPLRKRHDLSLGWEFVQGRVDRVWLGGRGVAGEPVDLPHCWNRGDTFQFGRRSYVGRGAYRKTINIPEPHAAQSLWRLRSEGFYGIADVLLDGKRLARVDSQYLGFDIDLPGSLTAGPHVLAVRLDNLFHRNVLPGKRDPDFLLHGGLAGRMWIEWVPALHIDTDRVEVVCTPGADGTEVLELRCAVNGPESSPKNVRLSWTVTAADGAPIAAAEPVSIGEGTVAASTTIPKPRRWSPDDPQLYWAECRLETGNGPADVVRVRFGITRAEFRSDEGLFLDGARVDLHGCNRHAAIPGLGNALPEEVHRADAQLLKDYGCNFVRLSHYPQHPAFLDACDELGILVYAEIASWKSVRSSRGWRRSARRQMRHLILRDRHHPSVILWGMGNESRSRRAFVELKDIARKLDPGRPVTYAENHFYRARRQHTVGIPDVWAVNYELEMLEEARDASRLRNVVLSECCNHPTSVKGDDREELTQVVTLEREWELMMDHPYLAGHAVWSLTDYATEHRSRFRRQTGLFDAWRRPKMAAELFRARYTEEPFISLFVIRSSDETEDRDLHVFSNCGRIELMLDGEPFATLEGALHHRARIDGGFEEIRANGTRQGLPAEAVIRRWGEAAAVALTINNTTPETGNTLAVDLVILDADGVPVRDWNGHVHLAAEGDARLRTYTDTGEVLMARGEGRAYLTVGQGTGEIIITGFAPGLEPGTTTIRAASP